jgi:hypothetical protein
VSFSKYRVKVRRIVACIAHIEVEAEDETEARGMALDLAHDRGAAWSDPYPERATVESVIALDRA